MSPLPPLLLRGNCLDELKRIPSESVDAVVTDPPYGLANTDPAHVVEALGRWAAGDRDFIPSGRGFMGKSWDAFVPPPAVWDEVNRILAPGGHLLAFAGSRTFDLMTLSIRLAGFEIRDSVAWLYGSGFPKSLDVSKAIDAVGGAHPDVLSFATHYAEVVKRSPYSHADIDRHLGIKASSCYWVRTDHRRSFPAHHHWAKLRTLLDIPEHFNEIYAAAERADRVLSDPGSNSVYSPSVRVVNAGTPQTDAARTWQGWGTALKPAFEPIIVARKPIQGTVAANVLAHGTGALNIDATRIGSEERTSTIRETGFGANFMDDGWKPSGREYEKTVTGRWPANVVLDEDQAAALDVQTGVMRDGVAVNRNKVIGTDSGNKVYGQRNNGTTEDVTFGGSGGASRFFYVAKAPKSERPVVDGAAHPTVKPLALMRWLCRLVTPPGGLVVDPFAGSGTTLEAAHLEGFESIGVEMTPEYWPLIAARIERVTK